MNLFNAVDKVYVTHIHTIATTDGASGSWEDSMKMDKLRVPETVFKNQEFKTE